VVLLPDGKTLVSSTKDGAICFWDTSVTHPRQALVTLPVRVEQWAFASDSQSVLVLDRQGQVSRWTAGTNFQQKEILLIAGTDLDSQIFSDDARFLATHRRDGVVRVWDLSSGKLSREWTAVAKDEQLRSFHAGGNKLVTWSSSDNLLHERDAATGLEIQSWPGPAAGSLYGFALSPDGQSCLSFGDGTDVVARNLAGKSSSNLNLNMEPALSFLGTAFSPNGKLFAVANNSGFAQVWDTAAWREVSTLRGYLKGVEGVSFSPDSRRLVTCSSDHDAIRLWATENWQDVLTLDAAGFFSQPAFSPDGNTLGAVTGYSEDVLHLWRAPSWDQIAAAEAKQKALDQQP
jgi:WD40 repeat protein